MDEWRLRLTMERDEDKKRTETGGLERYNI